MAVDVRAAIFKLCSTTPASEAVTFFCFAFHYYYYKADFSCSTIQFKLVTVQSHASPTISCYPSVYVAALYAEM